MKHGYNYEEHHRRAFEEAVAAIPTGKGQRNAVLLPMAAWHAVKLGVDEHNFVGSILAVSTGRDCLTAADAKHAFQSAAAKIGRMPQGRRWQSVRGAEDKLRQRQRTGAPGFVRRLIEAGGGTATFDDLAALSPMRQVRDIEDRPALQTLYFLLNLWRRDDLLFVFNKSEAGKPGDTLRTREEWTDILELPGDKIVPNPFSGKQGETNEGKPSFIADNCVCRFPYALLEFDDMPIGQQCAFWRGFLLKGKIKVASLVYSGGKSIHGLLKVDAASRVEWEEERGKLLALFASGEDPAHNADAQSLRVRQGTRIAGVTRADTGKVQRLLYIAPAEAAETP